MNAKLGALIAGALLLMPSVAAAQLEYNVREQLERMKQELELSPEQIQDVRSVLNEYKDEIDQAEQGKKEKLDKLLDEDQMDRFDDMDQSWFERISEDFEATRAGRDQGTKADAGFNRDSQLEQQREGEGY